MAGIVRVRVQFPRHTPGAFIITSFSKLWEYFIGKIRSSEKRKNRNPSVCIRESKF